MIQHSLCFHVHQWKNEYAHLKYYQQYRQTFQSVKKLYFVRKSNPFLFLFLSVLKTFCLNFEKKIIVPFYSSAQILINAPINLLVSEQLSSSKLTEKIHYHQGFCTNLAVMESLVHAKNTLVATIQIWEQISRLIVFEASKSV